MSLWKVALIDSGAGKHAVAQGHFDPEGGGPFDVGVDPTGHGSRLAQVLHEFARPHQLILGQVFGGATPTTVAAITAAISWALEQKAHLIHLSLGLLTDRPSLAQAIERATEAGSLVVAATPAQGRPVYPAAYPAVIAATGDARCAPGEISRLASSRFGGRAFFHSQHLGVGRGASVGAAFVTAAILNHCPTGATFDEVVDTLGQQARYDGPEKRSHHAIAE
jgi:hypothetical protein